MRWSQRVRLKNPRYFNDGMINAVMNDKDMPEMYSHECIKPKKTTEEDVVACIFEYVLTQESLIEGLKNMDQKVKRQQGRANPNT